MEIQHVNVKIFAREPAPADLGPAVAVFQRWIQKNTTGELLIDTADYRHVPAGPGVILIGHEAHYGLDRTGGRLGLLYNRRTISGDTARQQLRQAYDKALTAARSLAQEPEFSGKLDFDPGDVEVLINDRAIAPNTPETLAELQPVLEEFFSGLWGEGSFTLQQAGEPRDRMRIRVRRHSAVGKPA